MLDEGGRWSRERHKTHSGPIYPRYNLHVPVRVRAKPTAGLHQVVIHHTEHTKVGSNEMGQRS